MKHLKLVLAVLGVTLGQLALAILPLQITALDYVDNLPATDVYWFNSQDLEGGPLPLPAIESQSPGGFKVVYRRGSTIIVRLTARNPNIDSRLTGNLTLLNPRFVHYANSNFNVNLSGGAVKQYDIGPLETATFEWTLTGFPNCVTKGWIVAETNPWGVGFDPSEGAPQDAIAKLWLTLEAPTQHQSVVWHEVLDWTCGMADQSSSDFATRYNITHGMNAMDLVFYYNPALSDGLVPGAGPERGKVYLTGLFWNEFGTPVDLLCVDTGALLAILMQSQGMQTWCETVWTGQRYTNGLPAQFRTQPLKGIGSGAFNSYNFQYHVVANGTSPGSGGQIWDAAAKYYVDLGGQAFQNPATNWPMPSYWQTWFGGLTRGYFGSPDGSVSLDPYNGAVIGIFQDDPMCDTTPIPNGVF